MELCLQLESLSPGWRALELVLYLPWITYAILWVLALFHYDWLLWIASLIINYLLFVMLAYVAPSIHWISPMARPCAGHLSSFIYNGLYYQWPCVSIITSFSYTIVFLFHHAERRRQWWRHSLLDVSKPWSWWRWTLLSATLGLPPLAYIVFLIGTGIQSAVALICNILMAISVSALVLAVIPDTKSLDNIATFWKAQFGIRH